MRALLVFCLCLMLVSAASAAIPLCDYRSPRTDFSELGMSFSYQYHNDPYGVTAEDITTGQLNVDYKHLLDSPDFGADLSVRNDMTISVSGLSSFLATGEGNLKRYFSPEDPFFGFAGLSGKTSSSYKTIGISLGVGVGYGRFLNVTPLAKATVIDDYLVERQSITEHLAASDLEAIAYEIENAATYESPADLLRVLEEIVEGTGIAKAEGLDALDISEMRRIVEDNRYGRHCGGDAKFGLSYELINPLGLPNELLATVAFDYAFTTTAQAQFLVRGSVSSSYDVLRTYRLDLTVGCDYLITDLVSVFSSYEFSRDARDPYQGVPSERHNLSLDLVLTPFPGSSVALGVRFEHLPYYLEWNTDVTLLMSIELL